MVRRMLLPLLLLFACAGPDYAGWLDPNIGTAAVDEPPARPRDKVWRPRPVPAPAPVIGAAPEAIERRQSWRPRPRRQDIHLHGVSLANAARMLADAGGFDVAVDEGLPDSVSLDLRNADPYRALLTLAQMHGAVVERQGKMVVVRRADAAKPR